LNKLKTMNGNVRKTIKKRVAIVEFCRDESISMNGCRAAVKTGANLTKLANDIKRRTNRGNMLLE